MKTSVLEVTSANPPGQSLAGKYLTFRLGAESFGIDVLKIREIIRLPPITAVPQLPGYIKGVFNLRGKVIPVIDLRTKFGFTEAESTESNCIVVVLVSLASGAKPFMGVIVDNVEEVVSITAEDIEDTPDFGVNVDTQSILGMAKVNNAVKTLLNIDQVLDSDASDTLATKLQP